MLGARCDEDVAGVRVGVEEARDEDLLEGGARQLGGDRVGVDAGGQQRIRVGDLDGRDVAQG